jgi:hypothetical protein
MARSLQAETQEPPECPAAYECSPFVKKREILKGASFRGVPEQRILLRPMSYASLCHDALKGTTFGEFEKAAASFGSSRSSTYCAPATSRQGWRAAFDDEGVERRMIAGKMRPST